YLCAFLASISGAYIAFRFRKPLNLGKYRKNPFNSYLFPTIFCGVCAHTYHEFLQTRMLTGQVYCPPCHCAYSALSQLFNGFLLPFTFSSITSYYFAFRSGTFPTPNELFTHRESLKYMAYVLLKITKRNSRGFLLLLAINGAFG